MSTSDKSVIVSGINKSFGDVHALHDISFDVERGEVIGLLGPNGAGKTTMVHILSTLTRPDRGQAWVAGHDVVSQAAKVRRSIMLTSQQVALDNMLTGRQNLVMVGRLQGLTKAESHTRAKTLLHDFELDDAADRRVDTYSSGMRRRIDIACGLMVRPEVAFLDEPTTGLDPRSRQSIWDLVAQFKSAGITTVLTTQYLEEADALSDRIIVIDRGTIIAEGTADELKRRTGSGSCEIIPQDPCELSAIADVLDTLMLGEVRPALTSASDRIAFPAPEGVATVAEVLRRLDAAGIRFADVALRRPSLDDVFFALTKETMTRKVERPTAGVT
jgi:ABC-2 type transport system ATP-binding protein